MSLQIQTMILTLNLSVRYISDLRLAMTDQIGSTALEDPLKKIRRLDSDVPSDVALLSEDRPAAPERAETISLTLTLTPPVPVDPFKGLSHLRRKLKEDKFSKVRFVRIFCLFIQTDMLLHS